MTMPNNVTSHTLEVPGAKLYYEVRGSGPVLMLVGLPMASSGFAALAELLAGDYTVVGYDPRGISNSTIDDPDEDNTPAVVADDVHRVLAAVTSEPAYVFGSSGGAVTSLALVSRHPEQVRAVVAHEPPLCELLPDAAEVRVAVDDIYRTYQSEGAGPAFGKFMALVGFQPPESQEGGEAAPQEPSEQDMKDGERMLAHCLLPTTRYQPDIEALRNASTRVVVGVGATSKGELANRTAVALAERLATPPAEFPGDHAGFMFEAEPFAAELRRVLS